MLCVRYGYGHGRSLLSVLCLHFIHISVCLLEAYRYGRSIAYWFSNGSLHWVNLSLPYNWSPVDSSDSSSITWTCGTHSFTVHRLPCSSCSVCRQLPWLFLCVFKSPVPQFHVTYELICADRFYKHAGCVSWRQVCGLNSSAVILRSFYLRGIDSYRELATVSSQMNPAPSAARRDEASWLRGGTATRSNLNSSTHGASSFFYPRFSSPSICISHFPFSISFSINSLSSPLPSFPRISVLSHSLTATHRYGITPRCCSRDALLCARDCVSV